MSETPSTLDARTRLLRASTPAMFGALGGAGGFVLSRLVELDSAGSDPGGLAMRSGLWFMLATACTGIVLIVGALRTAGRLPEKRALGVAFVALVVGGFVGGYIAQRVAAGLVDSDALGDCFRSYRADRDDSSLNWCYANTVRVGRTVGWIAAGGIAGIGIGLAQGRRRNVQNSVAAGAIGGLVGGLLFDTIPALTGASSLAVSQLIALVIIGAVIGAASSLIEGARSKLWLEIQNGEARGRLLVMVEDVARLGSARTLELPVPGDRQIGEVHVTLRRVSETTSFEAHALTLLNGVPVAAGVLQHGDVLTIGATELLANLRGAPPVGATLAATASPSGQAGRPRMTAAQAAGGWQPGGAQAASGPHLASPPAPPNSPPASRPGPPPAAPPASRPRLPTQSPD